MQEIEAHLAECAECASLLEEEKSLAAMLAAVPDESPLNDVWVLVRARTRPRRAWSAARLRTTAPRAVRQAAALAAVIAVGAGVFYGIRPSTREIEKPEPAANVATVTVKWSDDPLGQHTDAVIAAIDGM